MVELLFSALLLLAELSDFDLFSVALLFESLELFVFDDVAGAPLSDSVASLSLLLFEFGCPPSAGPLSEVPLFVEPADWPFCPLVELFCDCEPLEDEFGDAPC